MPRDKYVYDLEEYFSSEKFERCKTDAERISICDSSEIEVIKKEIDRCRNDFRHAAKNWFYISHKSGESILFSLWDGQEIVVEKLEDMKSRGKPQYVVVIKSRQLGMSQLGCAIAAWKCLFRSNQDALIISEDDDKTEALWDKYTLPIYRQLPWFLRPNASSISIKKGIILDTDPKETSVVGLRSSIKIVAANSTGQVGQGRKLNMFHGSEFTSWPMFNDIIERGIENALYEHEDTIAILESTAKGSGTKTHAFWKKMADLGLAAKWETVFLPYFMDRTHVMAPHKGWVLGEKAKKRRETVAINWVRCDNKACHRYFNRVYGHEDHTDKKCRFCGQGTFKPYNISDQQLYWIEHREVNASDPRIVMQEQAITAEEAFVVFGDQVFSDTAIGYAAYTANKSALNPPYVGFFDKNGRFHGYKENSLDRKCCIHQCTADHVKDDNTVKIWDMPIEGASYYMGVDVGSGIKKDYTVAFVIKRGNGTPDIHVATWRDNSVDPYNASYTVNRLGRFYNDAQIAVEYTGIGASTADALKNNLQYPNVYRRKISGDFMRAQGNGLHFLTNAATKPKIITTMERWLKDELLVIRDPILVGEMKTFVRVEGTKKTEADTSSNETAFHDDYIMAAMIGLYTAHQDDYDEDQGLAPVKVDLTPENQLYAISCGKCHFRFGASDPTKFTQCVRCSSRLLSAKRNYDVKMPISAFGDYHGNPDYESDPDGSFYRDDLEDINSYLSRFV